MCASFALAIASRTAVDGVALSLIAVGVVLGLADDAFDKFLVCLGDDGVEGRFDVTGVVARDLDVLNVVVVWKGGLDTDGVYGALFQRAGSFFVDFPRADFRVDSGCRSLANRILSFVLAARVSDGVTAGIDLAVGGVVIPASWLAVPKLMAYGSSSADGDDLREDPDAIRCRRGLFGRASDDTSITRGKSKAVS